MTKKLIFAIHDMSPHGGQDRSTMEIFDNLAEKQPIEAYVYSYFGSKETTAHIHKVKPKIQRPVLLKSAYYYFFTALVFLLRKRQTLCVHATGACSLISDIIQVQFIHKSWLKHERPKGIYHVFLAVFDLFFEWLAFSPRKTYIAISNKVKNELSEQYGITKNVHVIYHGVDTEKFHPVETAYDKEERENLRKQLGISPEKYVVLLVGAYERKGIDCATNAIVGLNELDREKVIFAAIGSGNHQALRDRYAHQDMLFLENQGDIERFYRMADIFLLPSKYDPFGLVILEAMASGLPCIVSDQAGASELIVDGFSGFVIPSTTDDDRYSQAISRLVNNADLFEKFSRRGRQKSLKHSWEKVADEYQSVIGKLI